MSLVVPASAGWADATRGLPAHLREPEAIPANAPARELGNAGNWPSAYWPWLLDPATGWPTRAPGTAVTEYTVTGIPAAWRCLNFVANAVASCAPPIEFDSAGVRADPLSPVVERPWALLGAHEYWVQAVSSVLLYGDFIGINVDLDPATGYPRQVLPTHPNDVTMSLIDGLPVYLWAGEVFGWDEVTHVRGWTSPGALRGMGVIQAFRLSLGAQVDTRAYGANLHASADENSVVIQVDRPELTEGQAEAIQQRWIDRHGSGMRRPAVIPRSMTITPLAFSPADAQFLETRHLDIAETAYMFNLDPTDLDAAVAGGRGAITYANREQREVERITHSVGPWLRRFEETWSSLLPGRRNIAFDVERLLRTDTLTRMQATDIGLKNGTFTLNDARGIERLPLYPHAWATVPFGHPPDAELSNEAPPTGELAASPTETAQTAEAV